MSNENCIKLTDYLTRDNILFLRGRQNKSEVLNALIDLITEHEDIDSREEFSHDIFHRETLLSTGIGNNIAVPHTRLDEVDDAAVALAVVPEGVSDYQGPDGLPVKLVFMIVAGKDRKTIHIKLVSTIAKLFDGRMKAAFLASSDAKTCMDILTIAEK